MEAVFIPFLFLTFQLVGHVIGSQVPGSLLREGGFVRMHGLMLVVMCGAIFSFFTMSWTVFMMPEFPVFGVLCRVVFVSV